jgi:chemotaxis protein MotB
VSSRNDSLYEYPRSDGDEGGGWLLSYADLITLLISFFVVMLSASTMQIARFDQIKSAFTHKASPGDLKSVQAQLEQFIQQQNIQQSVSTKLDNNGLNIRFTNTVLFPSGQAAVTLEGQALLEKVTASLLKLEARYKLVIEGYTDEVPIHTDTFHSNWDLSAGRAIGVLQALTGAGLDPKRISIQGFADTRPAEAPEGVKVEQVDVEQRRAFNRRVVIRVY